MSEVAQDIFWAPQPGPQAALVNCPISEIFYGGARGGGKTDGMLGKNAIKGEMYGGDQHAIFFRRNLKQLRDAIRRSHQIYGINGLGWKWREQEKTYTSPKGATLTFAYLDRDLDADNYQGHSYTDVYFEELPHFPQPGPYNMLRGTLRSAAGVPTQIHGTGNPGGAGHGWIKERFITPNKDGFQVLTETLPNGDIWKRVFIPARVQDNKILMENDPGYINNLYLVGSANLVKAWLEGDWDVIEGAYFDCWSERMVIEPFRIPDHWNCFRSFDWGSAKPFSCGWWAVASEDYYHNGQRIPKGAMVRYRELYGAKSPNVGLKLTAAEVAEMILDAEDQDERFTYSVADPAIFDEDGGPSLAERMGAVRKNGKFLPWIPADNKRTSGRGRMGGWDQMRGRMKGIPENENLGSNWIGEPTEMNLLPMIYCFDTCAHSIRTIPMLQHDPVLMEDLDTEGEDHAADEWRYACMSRPFAATLRSRQPPKDKWDRKFDELRAASESWKT